MPVLTFILGRPGTGKTEHCLRAIESATRADPLGPPIFYLLPKQATFTAERVLTARLGAFTRPRVLSMEMLGEEILADCGRTAAPRIDALGRQLLIGHLLRKHQADLIFFRSSARQIGLASEIDSTFGEFERAGKTEADLKLLENELTESASDARAAALLTKITDLRFLYERYNAYLGAGRLDPHRRLTQVLDALAACSLFRDAEAYVDGFYEFTAHERRLILGLARACRRIYVTLPIDPRSPVVARHHELPHDLSVFHPIEQTYRRLRIAAEAEHVTVTGPIVMPQLRRFTAPDLAAVADAMATTDAPAAVTGTPAALRFIEAPDRRGEVDAAAREIGELLRADATLRLRDIAVLARDLDDYHEIIHATFNEHHLAFFADRRRTAAHHPVLQMARCALALARGHWPPAPTLTLLKTGLFPAIPLDAADELENYVLTHRIRGRAWARPWTFQRTIRHDADESAAAIPQVELARVNATRDAFVTPVLAFIRDTAAARTVKQFTAALFALYETLNVRATLAGWMAAADAEQRYEQRGEHEQVWTNFTTLLDQLVDLLGEQEVTLGDYQDILESGLERFDLALTPPTVDQILVGQLDRTRTHAIRIAVVLGLSEGIFPRAARDESIFSDHDRKNLRDRKVELAPEGDRRLLDENFLAHVAATRASEKLILTRPTSDPAGRPLGPSVYWRKLHDQLFPDAPVAVVPRESHPSVDHLATPRQLVVGLMRWARDPASHPDPAWPALYQWLAGHACRDDAVDVMRYAAWKALSYRNDTALSKPVAHALFPVPLRATVSRIESFATCPFQHFLRHGLGLSEREQADLTAGDMGAAFHSVLDHLVADMLRDQKDWAALTPDQARSLVHKYARQIAGSLRGELLLESARNQYILRRIERSLTEFVDAQRALAARGSFRPAHAAVRFGSGAGARLPPLRVLTPRGRTVELEGRIDRVDLVAGGPRAAVVDYKLTGDALALDRVYYGLALKLITDLLVLQAQGDELARRPLAPGAALYLRLVVGLNTVNHPDEAVAPPEEAFYLRVKPRGLVSAAAVPACDSSFSIGKSDVIAAQRNADGWSDRDRTDVAEDDEFQLLLAHVQSTLATLADELIDGNVAVRPYRLGDRTPCPNCSYRSVCRFDPAVNRYHNLPPMKKTQVWAELKAKGGRDHA